MTALDDLLVVQEHDTTADVLRHRQETLPERGQVTAGEAEVARLETVIATLGDEVHAIRREQKKREDDVALLEERWAELDKTLYSGSITAPKELQALQEEQGVIKKRQSRLEDEVLEHMEQAEPLDEQVAEQTAAREAAEAALQAAMVALAEAEAAVATELATVEGERAELAAGVPEALLAEYDRIRASNGGIGAARLVGGTCQGCNLGLPAVVVDRIKKMGPDEVAHCDECGRILVR
jgi:predicted  nucleic acid-binding Zn-ribbon protein